MLRKLIFTIVLFAAVHGNAQLKWSNTDTVFGSLPQGFHVYKTTDSLDSKPFIAYYAEAVLKNKQLNFTTDTTFKRRLTPTQFFTKNNQPLLVVNCTFFNFDKNQNLNVVIKDGKLVSYNVHSVPGRGKDTFTYRHPLGSAIGISKKREADVVWVFTDSAKRFSYSSQITGNTTKDSLNSYSLSNAQRNNTWSFVGNFTKDNSDNDESLKKWKIQTAVGGGPVLLQNGEIKITNNEELKFTGKAIEDKHPRTCMGYTADGRLIIMVIQGRSTDAAGATLTQEAQLLKDLGCVEALNLDGGGSSCMLINGKPTIKVSDKEGERPVPAVFIIKTKK
jgi:exopolysaccharide biosynthesis protein